MGRIGYHTLTEYSSLELAQTTYKHTNTYNTNIHPHIQRNIDC